MRWSPSLIFAGSPAASAAASISLYRNHRMKLPGGCVCCVLRHLDGHDSRTTAWSASASLSLDTVLLARSMETGL